MTLTGTTSARVSDDCSLHLLCPRPHPVLLPSSFPAVRRACGSLAAPFNLQQALTPAVHHHAHILPTCRIWEHFQCWTWQDSPQATSCSFSPAPILPSP